MASSFNVDDLGETETWMWIFEVRYRVGNKWKCKHYEYEHDARSFVHDQTVVLGHKRKYEIKEVQLFLSRTGARSKK